MRNILFTTDFSDCANNALKFALPLADYLRCKIYFMHSNQLPAVEMQMADILIADVMDQKNQQAIAALNQLKFRTSEYAFQHNVDIPVDHILSIGFPAEEIMKAAEQLKPELVVAGTTGEGGFIKFLFGSTTTHLIKSLNYPLLLVPADANNTSIKNIAYAAGLESDDVTIIEKLLTMCAQLQARLFVFHVDKVLKESDYDLMADINKKFPEAIKKNSLTLEVLQGKSIIDGIDHYLNDRNIDMLAMTHHRKPFLDLFDRKIPQKMAKHSTIPLLIYQEVV
ncbi:MAG: universal stress protein [Chitinophagales bacterium]|nr:universal stress protein [Bacteroidota bacterium]MBK8487864.1 universal stress protein [Bacteroidota bacterium]MBP7400502.1 universal stress protein [Chitinophagales bacterium]